MRITIRYLTHSVHRYLLPAFTIYVLFHFIEILPFVIVLYRLASVHIRTNTISTILRVGIIARVLPLLSHQAESQDVAESQIPIEVIAHCAPRFRVYAGIR